VIEVLNGKNLIAAEILRHLFLFCLLTNNNECGSVLDN